MQNNPSLDTSGLMYVHDQSSMNAAMDKFPKMEINHLIGV